MRQIHPDAFASTPSLAGFERAFQSPGRARSHQQSPIFTGWKAVSALPQPLLDGSVPPRSHRHPFRFLV